MAEVQELPLPKSGKINKICHISDIHIRAGTDNSDPKLTRFEEYVGVIDRISKWLEKRYMDAGDMVIIITGDIVHDNKKAGAPCIELFYEVMNRLAKIAPVYIIRGNHDYNQASVVPQDMLTSLMHGMKAYERVVYLKETGLYRAGDVGFGLVAIQDALKAGDTHGRVEDLPPFPTFDQGGCAPLRRGQEGYRKKIALFHGDVPGTYPLEWFGNGWDWILLGDIHRMQVHGGKPVSNKIAMTEDGEGSGVFMMNAYEGQTSEHKSNGPLWGYPGSTIQQNFGESMSGHGFLMWDLEKDSVSAYHVRNDYGFVTMRESVVHAEGSVARGRNPSVNLSFPGVEKNQDCWIDMDKALSMPWFPKIWRLRIRQQHSAISMVDLHAMLEQKGVVLENVRACWDDAKGISNGGDDRNSAMMANAEALDLKTFNDPEAWCNYVGKETAADSQAVLVDGWQRYFKQPDTLLIGALFDDKHPISGDVKERNAKITKALEEYGKACEVSTTAIHGHSRFAISYMDWSWVLCYRDGCWMNFKDLEGAVHCVGGKNGYGKTSFLECICLALYGEGFPSRSSKSYSASVICMQKPAKQRAYTSIVFEIDDCRYRIKRTFDVQSKDKDKLNAKDITLEKECQQTDCVEGTDCVAGGRTPLWEPVHSGKTATGDWVKKHLGDVDTFLTSVMITQGFDGDFFDMAVGKQKEYLDRQLRLDSSTAFLGVLKTASLAYDDLVKKLWQNIEAKKGELAGLGNGNDLEFYETLKIEHTMLMDSMARKAQEIQTLKGVWSVVSETFLSQGEARLKTDLDELGRELEETLGTMTNAEPNPSNPSERLGVLKQRWDELAKRVDAELLEDDVDLEGSLAELAEPEVEKPVIGGADLGVMKKAYLDVVSKLKEVGGDAATFGVRLEETRNKMRGLKENGDVLRMEGDAMQIKLNDLGGRMAEMASEPVAYSDKEYREWLKAIAHFKGRMYDDETKVREKLRLFGDLEREREKLKERADRLAEEKELRCLMVEGECACCMKRKAMREKMHMEWQESLEVIGELEAVIGKKTVSKVELERELEKSIEFTRLDGMREGHENAKRLREERASVSADYERIKGELGKIHKEVERNEREVVGLAEQLRGMEEKAGKIEGWREERKKLKKLVDALETWAVWERNKKELEDAIEAVGVKAELAECEKMVGLGRKMETVKSRMRVLEGALGVVREYEKGGVLSAEVEEMRVRAAELGARIGVMESMKDRVDNVKKDLDGMMGAWEKWRAVGETLKVVMGVFGRFKDWVLEERIVPVIVEGVNELLGVMCRNHRAIAVEWQLYGNAVRGCGDCLGATPQWIMKDGINKVAIEKASGFQRFAMSLAMRIVLGRLGVAGIKNRQLFVDEGFTACDGDNLSNVPDVLEELLDRYDTLVIVSHLEKLQEDIASKIEIRRDVGECVSWIGYGRKMEELETKKKVGRPSKKQ